jgi:competence ComEA-like helix-hairpin-helix protein
MKLMFSLVLGGSLAVLGIKQSLAATELQKLIGVQFVDNPSDDGDSFVVKSAERQLHLRLYFVDCPESVATTDADAKRVREQARYFGITEAKKVFEYGHQASLFTRKALAKPFTIYTTFSSALGRSPGGRVYAFVVTADGRDLGQALVEAGLGRTHGAKRAGPTGKSTAEIERSLLKSEAEAMRQRKGIWAATDSATINKLRAEQQAEDQEVKSLIKESSGKKPALGAIELNTATTSELQSISGVGPVLAAKIIAARPYKSVDDLQHVTGVGPKLFEKIRPYVTVKPVAR